MFNRFISWLFNLKEEATKQEVVFVDQTTSPVEIVSEEEVAEEAVSQPDDGLDSSVRYWLAKEKIKEDRKRKKEERLKVQ